MTNNEFKAWFEGFSEGVSSSPTWEQWNKVVAKVKTIDNVPVFPQVIYRDRWLSSVGPYYSSQPFMGATARAAMGMAMNSAEDQREALYNLGRTESQS